MGTSGKQILRNADETLYHLGVKEGDIYPRIITVGSFARAAKIAELLDNFPSGVKTVKSSRGYEWHTGTHKGVGVSIVAIGMGMPMMDFLVREASHLMPTKPMAIIRIGTCGLIDAAMPAGSVVVVESCAKCYPNYAAFHGSLDKDKIAEKAAPYFVSGFVKSSDKLTPLMQKNLTASDKRKVFTAKTLSGLSFYSTQGRTCEEFDDKNDAVMGVIEAAGVQALEMETHALFHLAAIRKVKCHAGAYQIGVVNRNNEKFGNVTAEDLENAERDCGRAALEL
eukprot:Selendium_serpulae@DN3290_c0_g1_i2.p1